MPAPIQINSNHRVLITGKTGSGKTYLSRFLTRGVNRLVVLDGKGTLSSWNLDPWNKQNRDKLISGEPVRLRAYPPFGDNILNYWDSIFADVYRAGNCTIYIDELYAVTPPNTRPSNNLWAIYTRGREIGLGVWASTQRPVWIPLFALSEAEHFFVFRLQLMDDRQRLAAFMGDTVLGQIPDEHGFFYSFSGWDDPIYTPRLEVKETPIKPVNTYVEKEPTPPARNRAILAGILSKKKEVKNDA